jgi:thiamine-monophosphate kinase
MPLSEFELIDRFFRELGARRPDVEVGVGDDAAVLVVPPGKRLVAAADALVEGIHFPRGTAARAIGHRTLAVNLSDIAAMGAAPAWAILSLTLPEADEVWLADFAAGLGELARRHDVALVGGDTTAGPLVVSLTILGLADQGAYLTRSGAHPGDHVFVSGTVGDAAAGLALLESRLAGGTEAAREHLRQRFLYPEARLGLGARLVGIASAAIDVSDGLAGDLEKLARASRCGARVEVDALPLSPAFIECAGPDGARDMALRGGDDYELCFAVPEERLPQLADRVPVQRWPYRRIGVLNDTGRIEYVSAGSTLPPLRAGYDHFSR